MTTAYISGASNGGWWLRTPYDATFVDELKGLIRYPLRKWDQNRKQWWIHSSAMPMALQIMRRHYDRVIELGAAPAQSANPYEALHLLPTAPPQVVKAAYRALAQLHHPDKGGDTAAMQAVNAAYEALTGARR